VLINEQIYYNYYYISVILGDWGGVVVNIRPIFTQKKIKQ